jgi:hypothetical protein
LDMVGPTAGFGLQPVLRRLLLLLPLAAILIIPILVRPGDLFGWAMGHGFSAPFGKAWMGHWQFVVRNIIYFVLWLVLGAIFVTTPPPETLARRRGLAAVGLMLFMFSMIPASVDWAVAVEPDWISPEFPLLLVSTQATIAISVALLLAGEAWRRLVPEIAATFLLIAASVWIFMQFIQFLVIWSADRVSDISWYLHRWNTGSGVAALIAFVIGFVAPVLVLLIPPLRRHRLMLPAMALLVLCAQALCVLWLITPSLRHDFTISWTDVLEFLAIGGLAIGACLWPIARFETTGHG